MKTFLKRYLTKFVIVAGLVVFASWLAALLLAIGFPILALSSSFYFLWLLSFVLLKTTLFRVIPTKHAMEQSLLAETFSNPEFVFALSLFGLSVGGLRVILEEWPEQLIWACLFVLTVISIQGLLSYYVRRIPIVYKVYHWYYGDKLSTGMF
jgi:hypothetical protein